MKGGEKFNRPPGMPVSKRLRETQVLTDSARMKMAARNSGSHRFCLYEIGGGRGIRTPGAFAQWFSRPPPSAARPSLREKMQSLPPRSGLIPATPERGSSKNILARPGVVFKMGIVFAFARHSGGRRNDGVVSSNLPHRSGLTTGGRVRERGVIPCSGSHTCDPHFFPFKTRAACMRPLRVLPRPMREELPE